MFGPPPRRPVDDGIEKPHSIKQVPKYIGKVIKSFFSRYFYIFKLVWETKPIILFGLCIIAIMSGLFPVLGAYITSRLLQSISDAYNAVQSNNQGIDFASLTFKEIFYQNIEFFNWLAIQFIYLIANSIFNTLNTAIVAISGERVANHIKVKIITKAKNIDIAEFDKPEFYEKLENASREASFRPVQILSSTFSMISSIISVVSFIIALSILSKWAPLIVIAFALPAAIVKFSYGRKNYLYAKRHSKERRQMEYYSQLMTNKDTVKEVRIFNLSDTLIGKFKSTFKKYFKGFKNKDDKFKEQRIHYS